MNVQPNAAAASIAGTSRAQAKGSDVESNQAQQASQSRAESPGRGNDGDQLSIDPSGESGDRGGDGRQVYDLNELTNEEEQAEPDTTKRTGASIDESGSELDLEA